MSKETSRFEINIFRDTFNPTPPDFQLSIFSFPFSTFHFQLFIFNFQFSTFNFQLSTFNFPFSTFHFQLSIFNFPFSTFNFQLFPKKIHRRSTAEANSLILGYHFIYPHIINLHYIRRS